MLIHSEMPLDTLRQHVGPLTDVEASALRASLVQFHNQQHLFDIPPLVMGAHLNHALNGLPDTVPGEFSR